MVEMNKAGIKDAVFEAGEFSPVVLEWQEKVEALSLAPPKAPLNLLKTAEVCLQTQVPLPIIISLCPGIENLDSPNAKGQTRRLAPLRADNPRLLKFGKELFEFHLLTRKALGVSLEALMIFADLLEQDAEAMFTNCESMGEIAIMSTRAVAQSFSRLDQLEPGKFQRECFRVPKVRIRSKILNQTGEKGIFHDKVMEKVALSLLTPGTPAHDLFFKHLSLTRDSPFISTGFQTLASARTVWQRLEFLLCEYIADGFILPRVMKQMSKKRFGQTSMPAPIFICSTTRPGGIAMEMDGFDMVNSCLNLFPKKPISISSIAIFKNIGRWLELPKVVMI